MDKESINRVQEAIDTAAWLSFAFGLPNSEALRLFSAALDEYRTEKEEATNA